MLTQNMENERYMVYWPYYTNIFHHIGISHREQHTTKWSRDWEQCMMVTVGEKTFYVFVLTQNMGNQRYHVFTLLLIMMPPERKKTTQITNYSDAKRKRLYNKVVTWLGTMHDGYRRVENTLLDVDKLNCATRLLFRYGCPITSNIPSINCLFNEISQLFLK